MNMLKSTNDRRSFLHRATALVAGAGLAQATSQAAQVHQGPLTKRWTEQRWTLDNTIRTVGMDWDQPRSIYLSAPCGPAAAGDFLMVRQRIQKYADAAPAFEAQARRREAQAKAAEAANELVNARDNFFIASVHWGSAQWPIDENNEQNKFYNQRKRECYQQYAKLADHKVEEVWIPMPASVGGKSLPGWLHLPADYKGGKIPVVINVPGMDSFKEIGTFLYGDKFLTRGIAVLNIDGPGQYESAVLDIHFSMQAWMAMGTACVDWLLKRPEIDETKIGMAGASFGSFFATIAASHEPRIRAVAVASVCHEPGFHTIFEEASPTFKMRFMYMSGFTDEAKFDAFRKTMTWEGHTSKLKQAYLCLAGESDELSPIEHTERLMQSLSGPKRLVVYQDSRHSVGNVPAAYLGPNPATHLAEWILSQLKGNSFPSERWFITSSGQINKTQY
jgi:dienelactone hydrolase